MNTQAAKVIKDVFETYCNAHQTCSKHVFQPGQIRARNDGSTTYHWDGVRIEIDTNQVVRMWINGAIKYEKICTIIVHP